MFRLVKQMYPSLSLAGKKRIIRSRDWLLFLKGRQLLNSCQKAVEQAENFIDDIYKKEKERGYQEGLAQARTEMVSEQIRFSKRLEGHFEKVEDDISALVCQLVEKIVGAIPEKERTVQMINKAISSLKIQERIKIYVRHEYVEAVHAHITETHRTYTAPGSVIVEPNSTLVGDQCVIESGGLIIDINLENYIKALRKSLKVPETSE